MFPALSIAAHFMGQDANNKQRRLEKAQHNYAIARAGRNLQTFNQERPLEDAEVRQGFYSSGMGNSSAHDVSDWRRENARQRAVQTLNEDIVLAGKSKKAWQARQNFNKQMDFFKLISMPYDMAQGMDFGGGGGGGGGGGMGLGALGGMF